MITSCDFLIKLMKYIDFYDKTFWLSAIMIIICPITWNLIARWEFHTKIFTKIAGDNRLAADIFAHVLIEMGILRNFLFKRTIEGQMHFPIQEEHTMFIYLIGYVFIIFGALLVFMVYYRLGIHGIYYGDYFGILMKEKVTAFPYNYINNPMYIGSTLIFLGLSVINISPTGLLLTALVWMMYKFASVLENPMTDLIYCVHNIKAVEMMKKERDEKEYSRKETAEVEEDEDS